MQTKLNRIALFKFTEFGKEYLAMCPRSNIGPGAKVEIEASDGTIEEGEIVEILHERWHCTKYKINYLAGEVDYAVCLDHCAFWIRTVKHPAALALVR